MGMYTRQRGEGSDWRTYVGDPVQAASLSYMVPAPGAAKATLTPAQVQALQAKYPDMARAGYQPFQLANRESWEQYLGGATGPAQAGKLREAWAQIVAADPGIDRKGVV